MKVLLGNRARISGFTAPAPIIQGRTHLYAHVQNIEATKNSLPRPSLNEAGPATVFSLLICRDGNVQVLASFSWGQTGAYLFTAAPRVQLRHRSFHIPPRFALYSVETMHLPLCRTRPANGIARCAKKIVVSPDRTGL